MVYCANMAPIFFFLLPSKIDPMSTQIREAAHVAEAQPTPNSRGERALYVSALIVTRKAVFFQKHPFSTGNPVINLRYFDEF